jgi:putative phosphoesterase
MNHMRLAVFGDVHGNRHALEAVLADISQRGVDATYCLGDLVGYGAFPNEVTARVSDAAFPTIMGNYDDGVGFERDECGCAYKEERDRLLGDRSLAWTKAAVTAEHKAFLRQLLPELRLTIDGRRVLLVHGSPRRMNEYLFEDRPLSSFQRLAAASNADVIVFGHTHQPYVKQVDGVWFVNAGSVGKPKDGDPRACYAILEPAADPPASFVRVGYDVAAAATAIRDSGLPHEFAVDVETGGRR